jgi:hypothetical protein
MVLELLQELRSAQRSAAKLPLAKAWSALWRLFQNRAGHIT